MTNDFIFKALVFSLTLHTLVICTAYWTRINDPHYKTMLEHRIEISYKPFYKKVDIHEYPVKPAQRLDLSNNQRLFSDGTIPVSLVKERQGLPFAMVEEHKPDHMRNMELSRRVSIIPLASAKINNPIYAAYQTMVRDRIKEKVDANYDRLERGIVYLTFLVDNHGNLKAARIVPERTNASAHLQELAFRSLQEANPFPAFLKGMSLSEYSFNIEIQYQVSDE